jgi:hypothetical protein
MLHCSSNVAIDASKLCKWLIYGNIMWITNPFDEKAIPGLLE